MADVAAELERGLDALVDEMFVLLADDPLLLELMTPEHLEIGKVIARADLLDEIVALARGGEVPTACPAAVLETARRTVELEVPATVPIQCYRAGHRVLWRAWRRALTRRAEAPELAEAGGDFFFAYADRCCSLLLAEYEAYSRSTLRGRDRGRLADVRAVLEGRREAFAAVDYALERTHVAFVAVASEAARIATDPARNLDGGTLLVPFDTATVWGWAPRGHLDMGEDAARHVGVGAPGRGLDGFRRSHRQAQRALSVALRGAGPVCRYEDVALEGLAGADDRALLDFVEHELAGLDDPRPARAPLRKTVLAYFGAGDSLAMAARGLGVHERTVAYRIGVAEQRLGHRLQSRRAELEAALRLEPLLAARS